MEIAGGRGPRAGGRRGFTLVELLVVIGIISVMLVAIVPAVNSLSKGAGRKGAVGNLLSGVEQARALAITERRNTYVAFITSLPGSVPPSLAEEYSYRAWAVFADAPGGGARVQVTKWQQLPRGISFRSVEEPPEADGRVAGTCITSTTNTQTGSFPFSPASVTITCPYLQFDLSGSVVQPTTPAPLRLVMFEGAVAADAERPTARDSANQPVRAEIQLAKFTGRAKTVIQ